MRTATLDSFDTSSVHSVNVGDVVTLRSGGARMTVTYVGCSGRDDEGVLCQWFDEHGELRQERFDHHQLQREPRSIPAGSVKLRAFTPLVQTR
jgi:uncharacterized protein YodC (DUF2158 family)